MLPLLLLLLLSLVSPVCVCILCAGGQGQQAPMWILGDRMWWTQSPDRRLWQNRISFGRGKRCKAASLSATSI